MRCKTPGAPSRFAPLLDFPEDTVWMLHQSAPASIMPEIGGGYCRNDENIALSTFFELVGAGRLR